MAAIIAPLFVVVGIGFAWARLGKPFHTDMVAMLVANIGGPCLIFSSLTKLQVSPLDFTILAGAFVAVMAANLAVGALALRLMGLRMGPYLPALTFANTGNIGLPLCLFAFGDAGLALAISGFFIVAVGNMTIGVALMSGRLSLRQVSTNPYLYVIAAALAFMITDTRPPAWIANTVELLGGVSIPLMLLALGVTIAKLRVRSIPRSVALSALRLGLGFALGVAMAHLFGLTGVSRGVLILQSAMPVAVMNFLFASRYGCEPEEVAGMIVASTALSFLTLPALLYVVL